MALKPWDEYVIEADRDPIKLPFNGEDLVITMPTDDQCSKFNNARYFGQTEEALKALLGDNNGVKVYAVGKDAPKGALDALMNDVLDEFGLRQGNSKTSSS
jgi:hypothetical protein